MLVLVLLVSLSTSKDHNNFDRKLHSFFSLPVGRRFVFLSAISALRLVVLLIRSTSRQGKTTISAQYAAYGVPEFEDYAGRLWYFCASIPSPLTNLSSTRAVGHRHEWRRWGLGVPVDLQLLQNECY